MIQATLFGKLDLNPQDRLVVFDDCAGFALLKKYADHPSPEKYKMMIKISKIAGSNSIRGSINMILDEKDDDYSYPIIDGADHDYPVTNFSFGRDEGISFDEAAQQFSHAKHKKTFSLEDFILVLVANHMKSRRSYAKIRMLSAHLILGVLFFAVDMSYAKDTSLEDVFMTPGQETKFDHAVKEPDPFFRYFKISRNILFLALSICMILLIVYRMRFCRLPDISVGNGAIIAIVAFSLFAMEKSTECLLVMISNFKNGKSNFIKKLHNVRHGYFDSSFDIQWSK